MVSYRITVRCKTHPETHAKVIRLRNVEGASDYFDRTYAENFAKLLDGTFPGYIYPPGPDSPIGKCGICGGKLETSVEERDDEGNRADVNERST